MKGIFNLASAPDLLKKLEGDYERVTSDPLNSYAAYDFVVTAWHLLEWQYPDAAGKKPQRIAERDRQPVLQVCEHLAVGAKHFEPQNPKLQSVKTSGEKGPWAPGVWAEGVWAKGTWADALVVKLDGNARTAFGNELTVQQLADRVMKYWRHDSGLASP